MAAKEVPQRGFDSLTSPDTAGNLVELDGSEVLPTPAALSQFPNLAPTPSTLDTPCSPINFITQGDDGPDLSFGNGDIIISLVIFI